MTRRCSSSAARSCELEMEHKGVLLGVRCKGSPRFRPTGRRPVISRRLGSGAVQRGLTDRRHRPTPRAPTRGRRPADAAPAVRRVRTATRAHRAGRQEAVPGTIDDDMAIVRSARHGGPGLLGRHLPRRADQGLRGAQAGRGHVRHGAWRASRWKLTCLLVSRWSPRRAAHAGVAGPRRALTLEVAGAAAQRASGLVAGWSPVPFSDEGAARRARRSPCGAPRRRGRVGRGLRHDLRLPGSAAPGETDEGGRGLYLVDQLATVGLPPDPDGKAVWFEMPLRGEPSLAHPPCVW